MRREDLERWLEQGSRFGFVKETDSDQYLGWILLTKEQPNDRYLGLLRPGEQPDFVAEQERIRAKPYQVMVLELRKEVHESGAYESNEDYRMKELYRFGDLDEVADFVARYGHPLDRIKWSVDIDAP